MDDIKEWFFDSLPFKRKTAADWVLPALLGLGVGVAAGVGVGMLYAPDTGEETRLRLRESANRVKNRAARMAQQAKEQIAQTSEQIQSQVSGT